MAVGPSSERDTRLMTRNTMYYQSSSSYLQPTAYSLQPGLLQ